MTVIAGAGWIGLAYIPPPTVPEPLPTRPDPYSLGWDGKHCMYVYGHETLLDFPAVPTFNNPGGNK